MIADFAIVSSVPIVVLAAVHTVTFAIGHRIGRSGTAVRAGHDLARPAQLVHPERLRRRLRLVGLWLITLTAWWSLVKALSPITKYLRGRPGFSEYQRWTSFFIPCPPRSARS